MVRGLVIGRFYPIHRGHLHLIDTALAHCDRLSIVICFRAGEHPAAEWRFLWARELFPYAEITLLHDVYDHRDSVKWAEVTKRHLGFTPDRVFTSEEYGDPFAVSLGCEHFAVDPPRSEVPVSARLIRADPIAHWRWLPPPVRSFYARRYVFLGPESAGKSTICRRLANYFSTLTVPEILREWAERKYDADEHSWTTGDFIEIAREQNRRENRLARVCDRRIFCDTDSFAVYTWHTRYIGKPAPEILEISREHQRNFAPTVYFLVDHRGVTSEARVSLPKLAL